MFFLQTKNVIVTTKVIASAAVTASQIPSIPKRSGSRQTAAIWNTSVRKKEIAADTAPLLRAVKKEEAKKLKPHMRKHML